MRLIVSFVAVGLAFGAVSCTKADRSASPALSRACSPARDYWQKPQPFAGLSWRNHVAIDHSGIVYWNGQRITRRQLADYLEQTKKLLPQPDVFLETEAGTPCAAIEAVRDEMDRRLACRTDRHCAEGIYGVWEHLPMPPGTPPS